MVQAFCVRFSFFEGAQQHPGFAQCELNAIRKLINFSQTRVSSYDEGVFIDPTI